MNDWSAEVTERYGLKVQSIRRGRGSWILDAEDGLKLLKEYKGSVKRLEFEEQALSAVTGTDGLRVDQYVRNRDGELCSAASDGTRYVVKDWFSDRECDLRNGKEVLLAVRRIASLHLLFRRVPKREEWNLNSMISPPLYQAMEKHNRELKKARSFIRAKRRKNEFELCVIGSYDEFFRQAEEARHGMEELFSREEDTIRAQFHICHGDLDQHHVLMGTDYVAVTEFNKMHLGLQVEDVYDFFRKVMEKNGWNESLGRAMLDAYESILPLGSAERECLYYLFLYPEKYWKQINFYYNANKAWAPARNSEKIRSLEEQKEAKARFLAGIWK